jgi:ESS family glutamate:Na+ symporter
MGLAAAPEVAVAAATLAVISGAIIAGPLTGWLVRRHDLHGSTTASGAPWLEQSPAAHTAALPIDKAMRTMLLMIVAILIGETLNAWANAAGLVLPGFLTAMLAGVLITNVADASGANLDFGPIERNALQAFLAMYLMSLKLWTIGAVIVPLAINVTLQIVITTLVAFLVVFRLLGRDYEAAITAGGFIGFGLSSMAVGMATMDKVASRYGRAPKAFLLITLAGSFFVDLANAFVVQAFLALPMFR